MPQENGEFVATNDVIIFFNDFFFGVIYFPDLCVTELLKQIVCSVHIPV